MNSIHAHGECIQNGGLEATSPIVLVSRATETVLLQRILSRTALHKLVAREAPGNTVEAYHIDKNS